MALPQSAQHIANAQGDFAPQHQNNWMLEISGLPGDGKDLILLSLVSSALPTETSETIEIPYGNSVRKVAGKTTFESIPLVVNDFVDRDVRAALMAWRAQVYEPNTENVGRPSAYKKEGSLVLQASDGTLSRKCRLQGLWPSSLNGGTLDMSSAEPVQIELTLEYDKAIWDL